MSSRFFPSPSILALLQIPINCEFALATAGLYDYTLTFDRELRYIWKRKFNWVSALFCVNRYLVPLTSTLIFWKNASSISSGRACTAMVLSQMIVDIMMSVCAAIFYALQAFALYNRQRLLLLSALALGLATPIITLCVWSVAASKSLDANQYGQPCSSLAALIGGTYDGWLVAARVASLAANCLILALIIIKCHMLTKSTRGLSLTSLLIGQGSLFLVAMALPNFVGIGLGKIPVLEANIPLHNEVTTSILISRFILTLRTQRSLPDTTEDLEGSTVTFASMSTLRTNAMEPAYQGSEPVTTTIYSTI